MTDETCERGLEIRREMFGRELTDAVIARADEFTLPIQDLVTRCCFGAGDVFAGPADAVAAPS